MLTVLQITLFTHVILQEGEGVVITEIEKPRKLIIPKRLIKVMWGDVRVVGITKTAEGIELSKLE